MRGFHRSADGRIRAELGPLEAQVLMSLARMLVKTLAEPDASDPALGRLLPDAYPDDAEASAEFRRLTAPGLVTRKLEHARGLLAVLEEALESAGETAGETLPVELDDGEALAWVKALTDVRLIIATRLGIVEDDQRSDDETLQGVYDWLGWLQNAIIEVLEHVPGAPA